MDSGGGFAVLITDLSKAFDYLHHGLFWYKIGKINSTTLYLLNRKQRVKVGNAYSSWKYIFYGILHGSILGPLIFNILFYFLEDVTVASSTGDATPYSANKTNYLVIKEIEHFSKEPIVIYY